MYAVITISKLNRTHSYIFCDIGCGASSRAVAVIDAASGRGVECERDSGAMIFSCVRVHQVAGTGKWQIRRRFTGKS
ncbi:MAG: hypothetical protein U9Q68_05450 [Euryarchaeota archaeon]|nr:hypothetical protein [Euryarchaeota archaeon]